jgi:cellobiose phosphorylase
VTYQINVKRIGPGNNIKLTVDGKAVDGNIIPVPKDGRKTINVDALLK